MKVKELLKMEDSRYPVRQILRWLWRAWRGNRLQAGLNAALGLIGVVISLSQVWAVQHAIDVAAHTIEGSLYWSVTLMGLLILCDFALHIASIWVRNILGIRAQNRMQQRMLDRILRSEWHVGAFFYLFSMDALLAVLIIIMLPIFILVSKVYVKQMRKLTRKVRDSDSKVQSVLQETVQNRMLIKTLESDSMMVGKLESTQSELRHNVVKRTIFSVFSNLILNFGFALGYLIAFLWSAMRMYNNTLSFGGMTAFLQLVAKIQGPARSLTKLVPAFVSVFTAAERLMELEENPLEEQGDPIEMDSPCGVRLDNVSYAYTAEDGDVVKNLTFDFYPGSCTAILGETGAGKTTLVRMILALIKPQSGNAIIYNKEKEHQLSPLLRCNFVYVPQGNTLLSGTIRENLRLGRVEATEEDMNEALKQACADFVFSLPQGIDTICSESGGGLSEGQAQRIAIARALLRRGSIMLFDEATSALDPDTERQLLQNILEKRDKTVIFITHRPAVVDYCDQTLHIEKI